MLDFLKHNHLMTPSQSGFIPGDSTIYQLLCLYNDQCRSSDRGLTTRAIFCDISNAFDRVWHRGLIHKLEATGIRGALLRWFKEYLKDRRQAVVIKAQKSDYVTTSAGLPQGSVLGPLLFLIYIHDIVLDIQSICMTDFYGIYA